MSRDDRPLPRWHIRARRVRSDGTEDKLDLGIFEGLTSNKARAKALSQWAGRMGWSYNSRTGRWATGQWALRIQLVKRVNGEP